MRQMKSSNIEWLGAIPSNWDVLRVKNGFTQKKSKAHQEDPVVLSLARSGVKIRNMESADGQFASSYFDYNPVAVDDMLINPMDLISGDNCSLSKVEGVISPAYVNLRYREGFCPEYYQYYFKYQYWCKAFFAHGKGVSFENRWTLNNETLMKFPLLVPPLDIQKSIANFLDKKCSEIDSLQKDIEQQIETLEAYKKSIITEAVTKGLNHDVEMKDSGIEWIDKIPKNWTLSRLKYNLSEPMKYGASEAGVDYSDELPRYIRITDITSDNKLKEEGKLSLTHEQAKGYILNDEAVLFARSGGTVGKTFLYTKDYGLAAFAGYLISGITDKTKMYSKWLWYFSLSDSYWEWANRIFTQATIQNIGADKYSNLPITVPDILTQENIINYLDTKCNEIDETIFAKREQLEILAEYKKNLIYEYVTGKKEVPNE